MSQKPRIPKGTRDFSPAEMSKRQYILDCMAKNFQKFGFQPIETPSFELSEILLGKYGDEGDRLIFRILNSGDKLKQADTQALSEDKLAAFAGSLSEKALRYDLTVPFARYVAQHQNDIQFPFKRYQIQPVWRADRPQKGRFQEFFQCDADIVGSKGLWSEVEFVLLYDAVFTDLGLEGTTIKINNRKVLSGIAQMIGASDRLIDFTVALDKLDKIGEEAVKAEMLQKGIAPGAIEKLEPLFRLSGDFDSQLKALSVILKDSYIGLEGIEELNFIAKAIAAQPLQSAQLQLDVTLARGLNYYTGAIFEVEAPKGVEMGSIGGGGRYDDLTTIFGLNNVSGVGISFGLDRIYLVMEELDKFPPSAYVGSKVLFLNFGEAEARHALKVVMELRLLGIASELYPDDAKPKKQMQFANAKGFQAVVLIGENELENDTYTLKMMASGDQKTFTKEALLMHLQQDLI
ncbi:MAG: histidine--tRNA ligase [Bacteroidetes bacterium]|nr:histidine--tRNA ligase [Bacteroidota bacterium]MDA0878896.1 histidine--tRNA ligase [Bacteroidota bacterium]MDA1115116.1 histidine--tRNA ligase [Bacteroidota bacterium]